MPQSPLVALVAKVFGGTAFKPLSVDGNGNLLVSSADGSTPPGNPYVACPASATTALGSAGAVGDTLSTIVIVPGTTSPGEVQIKDGAGTAIVVFTGGDTSVADLKPIEIDLNAISAAGGWSVITGANVTAIAVGKFA